MVSYITIGQLITLVYHFTIGGQFVIAGQFDIPDEVMQPHLVADLLGFATGLALAGLIIRLIWKGAGQRMDPGARYCFIASTLMWNIGGLGETLLIVFGMCDHLWIMRISSTVKFAGGAFFPPAFLALWQRPTRESLVRSGLSWFSRLRSAPDIRTLASRALCWIAILSAIILTGTYIWLVQDSSFSPENMSFALARHDPDVSHPMGILLSWHVALVLGLGALVQLPGRLNDFVSKFFATTTLIGACAPAVLTLTLSLGTFTHTFLLLTLIAHQSPLLISLGAIVFFSDFRFSNVFIKTSLQLLAALTLALIYCVLMSGPVPNLIRGMTDYPLAVMVSVGTVKLVLFMWAFMWLNPILGRVVDRWLFREPDYSLARRTVWEKISAEDESEVVLESAACFVKTTLELEDVRVLAVSNLKATHLGLTLKSGEVYQLNLDDPVKQRVGPDVSFLAPVRIKGTPTFVLAIVPGATRRDLFNSEISFVRAVSGLVSSRLEALKLEQEKADRQNREERLKHQVTEAELRALRAQINPHFLFNSLNTIADLIVTDPEKAELMIVRLSRVFRQVLSRSEQQMISVAEEIEFLRTYLGIESVRFGDRMQISFDVDEAALNETVPSLILQPVVENALKHGLANKVGTGTLQISVRRDDGFLTLRVEDDGLGFDSAVAAAVDAIQAGHVVQSTHSNGVGVGLRNVRDRLNTIYSGQARVSIENRPAGGSSVTIILPEKDVEVRV